MLETPKQSECKAIILWVPAANRDIFKLETQIIFKFEKHGFEMYLFSLLFDILLLFVILMMRHPPSKLFSYFFPLMVMFFNCLSDCVVMIAHFTSC